jgi:hypothetical protein
LGQGQTSMEQSQNKLLTELAASNQNVVRYIETQSPTQMEITSRGW